MRLVAIQQVVAIDIEPHFGARQVAINGFNRETLGLGRGGNWRGGLGAAATPAAPGENGGDSQRQQADDG